VTTASRGSGAPAPANLLIDPAALERAYFDNRPDVANPQQLVSFGTSGHRGTSADGTFTEVLAAEAACWAMALEAAA